MRRQTRSGRYRAVVAVARVLSGAAILVAATADDAHALLAVNPFGDAAVIAYVNHDPVGNDDWVNWKNKSTGACAFTFLGYGGLNSYVEVRGGDGDDTLIVVTNSGGTFCGYQMAPPNYNGYPLNMNGWGGNDQMSSGFGRTILQGSAGNDTISTQISWLTQSGEDGNDSLMVSSNAIRVGGGLGALVGGDGNDCLMIPTNITNMIGDCGSGFDSYVGNPSQFFNCDLKITSCCPGFIC
jgi:hypothetical protein